MSNVTLTIGGRAFTVACASGEEEHVAQLGQLIDAKAAAAGVHGQTETRMLLFASLLLADEVHELRTQVAAPSGQGSPELAERLDGIARRIENLAGAIESGLEPAHDNP